MTLFPAEGDTLDRFIGLEIQTKFVILAELFGDDEKRTTKTLGRPY